MTLLSLGYGSRKFVNLLKFGAANGIRTHDLFLTKEVLYRLSYGSPRGPDSAKKLKSKKQKVERETGLEPATLSLEG
jgi:hypothetical protein